MLRKLIFLIFSLILLSNLVYAADRNIIFDYNLENNFKYEDKEFPLGLKMYEMDNAPVISVLNGNILEEDSKTTINGLILTSLNFFDSNGKLTKNMLLANGLFEVKRGTQKIKIQNQNEIFTKLSFTTQNGILKIGDYSIRCKKDKECKLSFEMVGNEREILRPWINIEGEAEILKLNDGDFKEVLIKDFKFVLFWEELHDVDGDKNLDKILKIKGLPLKKTSQFFDALIQSKKPIAIALRPLPKINNEEIVITGTSNIELRNIPQKIIRFLINSKNNAKLNLWENNKKILTITEGYVHILKDFNSYSACSDTSSFCVLVDDYSIKIKPNTIEGYASKTIVYPNSQKQVSFDRIIKEDLSSSYLFNKNKKLEFTSTEMKKIPKKTDVFSFKTDFTAQLYSNKDKMYHEYKCLWKERKCFYDDKEVSQGFTDLRSCFTDDDCLVGEFCSKEPNCKSDEEDLCAEKRCLKEVSCEETKDVPGRILFLADGYGLTKAGDQEFKQDVNTLLNEGLFTFDPFNSIEARAALTPLYMNVGSLPSRFDGVPLMDLAQNYKEKCEAQINKNIPYTVVLSKGGKSYRAWTHVIRNLIVMPLSSGQLSNIDKRLFVHEFGHLFADLSDEYIQAPVLIKTTELLSLISKTGGRSTINYGFPNCAKDIEQAKLWLKNMTLNEEAYGNFQYKGCGGDCTFGKCGHYIKPSENSIMANHETGEFNEPSKWAIRDKLRELTGLGGIL